MKKIIALALAVLMLLPVLVACNTNTNDPAVTTTAGGDGGTEDPSTTTGAPVTDAPVAELPEGKLDFDVKVLARGGQGANWIAWDVVYDDSDVPYVVDTLNNAIKNRNDAMEDKYGITFTGIFVPSVESEAEAKISANKNEYDLILPTIYEAGRLAQKGRVIPTQELDYVDLSKPWYDQRCVEELDIKGKNFFFLSDITAVDLDAIWTYFFNHALIDKYDLDDPYELVADKKWTLDAMLAMCEVATEDSDNNPTKEDAWGLVGHDYIATSLYIGSGERVATADDEGNITLTMNANAGRVVNLLESINDMRPYWCRYALNRTYGEYGSYERYGFEASDDYPELVGVFTSGHALFMGEVLSTLREFADYDMKIGVLPTPMFEESQKEYYCAVNDKAPAMCVPNTCEDTRRISIVIEAWAYESHSTLLPAYYDNCMTTRYAKDAITSDILDMIFASRTYDLGIYYGWGNLATRFTAMAYNGSSKFASMYSSNSGMAKMQLDAFMRDFG